MKLPDWLYDILKWVMILGVPVGAFITSLIAAFATKDPSAIITAIFTGIASIAGIIIKASDSAYQKEISAGGCK